eukprot:scaffold27425_cov69-Phaeocystis_antarctica.AAC.3
MSCAPRACTARSASAKSAKRRQDRAGAVVAAGQLEQLGDDAVAIRIFGPVALDLGLPGRKVAFERVPHDGKVLTSEAAGGGGTHDLACWRGLPFLHILHPRPSKGIPRDEGLTVNAFVQPPKDRRAPALGACADGQLLTTRAKDQAVLKRVARLHGQYAAKLRDFLLLLVVFLDSQARTEAGLAVESLAGPATYIPRQTPGRATSCFGGGQCWWDPGERRATQRDMVW